MHDPRVLILAVSIFFFVFSCIFVLLNQISALFIIRRFRGSDYFMVLAWVLDCGFVATLFLALEKGFGLHQHDIDPGNIVSINKSIWGFHILYDLSSIAAKNSILVFYLILTYRKRVYYWANWVIIFVLNAVGLALTINQIFQCHPMSAVFQLQIQSKETCTNIFLTAISSSPYNIATDIAILVMPVPLLTEIYLPFKQRVILVIVFSAGISVIVTDIIRVAFLESAAESELRRIHSYYTEDITNEDYTSHDALSAMWAVVEVNLTIICACIPSIRPLAARIAPILIQSRDTRDSTTMGRDAGRTQRNAVGAQGANSEMMEILTRPEKQRQRLVTRDPYPRQIKLLNLLNLRPRRMLRLNNKQSLPPNILVTTFFFLWGTAFGLFSVLGQKIELAHIGPLDTYLTQGAYFLGALPIPLLLGRFILKRLGFGPTFISGLFIYALGALLFWPAAVLVSFPLSFVSNFIIGSGLGILEMTANLYISICGPLDYAEARLCIAQGCQGLGSLASQLFADKVLLPRSDRINEVIRVQWVYLAIALFNVVLAVCFYYIPVPEATDKDLHELSELRSEANNAKIFKVPVIYVTLFWGVWSQFFQTGGNQMRISNLPDFAREVNPNSKISANNFISIGTAVWTCSRFLAALILMMGIKARWTLLLCFITSILCSVVCLKTDGLTALVMDTLLWFSVAPMYPIIYAMSMRGMGVHVKTATAFMAAARCSGFLSYPTRYAITLATGAQSPYTLIAVFLGAGILFPLYLNLMPAAKRQVDPIKNECLDDFNLGVYGMR